MKVVDHDHFNISYEAAVFINPSETKCDVHINLDSETVYTGKNHSDNQRTKYL